MTPISCFYRECNFILKSTLPYFRLYFNSGNFMDLCVSRCILRIRPWGWLLTIRNAIFRRNRNPQSIRSDHIKHKNIIASVVCLQVFFAIADFVRLFCVLEQTGLCPAKGVIWHSPINNESMMCSSAQLPGLTVQLPSAVVAFFFLLPWSPNILIMFVKPTRTSNIFLPLTCCL